jgi:hypothetical protein
VSLEAAAIYQHTSIEPHRLGAADVELEPVPDDPAAFDRCPENHHGAGRFGVALIGEHQRVAVDDAGRRGDEAADRRKRRFDPAQLVGVDIFEIADAIGQRAPPASVEQGKLALLAGDDELAEPLVRHAALGAIGIKHLAPGAAGSCFEAALRVLDPGVDHLAKARRGLETDTVFVAPAP